MIRLSREPDEPSATWNRMPRYFIDLHDGSQPVRDEIGFELPDLDAARGKVTRIFSAIAQDMLPEEGQQDYVACVRDLAGTMLLRARITLVTELGEEASPA